LKASTWTSVAMLDRTLVVDVTIVPNNLQDTLKLKMTTGAHWTFLADVDLEVRETLGIEEYVDDHHTASVPHTVVLGPGLEIFKVYVGFWFFGRPSVYDLWNDMRELRMKTEYNFDPLCTRRPRGVDGAEGGAPPGGDDTSAEPAPDHGEAPPARARDGEGVESRAR
jgi:hypothetical protein